MEDNQTTVEEQNTVVLTAEQWEKGVGTLIKAVYLAGNKGAYNFGDYKAIQVAFDLLNVEIVAEQTEETEGENADV